jgi:hypothetical protein
MLNRSMTLVAVLALGVGGCATVNEPSAPAQASLPAWTQQTQFEDSERDRQVFVGIGQGSTEALARQRARSDAQAEFIRAVGGVVVTSKRVTESTQTGQDGISNRSVSGETYTGSTSSALLHSTEIEYVTTRGDGVIKAYARLSVPTEVLNRAREQVRRDHERAIFEAVEARRLARESRTGDIDGYSYAFVVESSQASRSGGESFASVEREAKEKARHQSQVTLTQQVHGVELRSVSASANNQVTSSYTMTSGKVHTEIIAERVWWEGDTAVAESYMLGWKKQE